MSAQTKGSEIRGDKSSEKQKDIRILNIQAGKAVGDTVRTSLGPRGMDKMIQDAKGEVLITNDGATILKQMAVVHPVAKMLVDLSKSQDIEAGDGTTTVVVLAASLLNSCQLLLEKGIHPAQISEGFHVALAKALEIVDEMSIPVDLKDRNALIQNAITSLSSKVVSQNSDILAPLAVDSVLKIIDPERDDNVNLSDIRVSKKLGGVVDDTELVEGLVFTHNKASHAAGGPTRIQNAKIGLIQFCLSAPKTDMDNNIIVSDYTAMDRVLKQEKKYTIDLVKKIAKTGCNVLLIQKSILRDATSELSLHYLAKAGIMVIKEIERDDIEFISKTIGTTPVAHIDQFIPEKLGKAALVEETSVSGGSKVVKVTGVQNPGRTVSILARGSNQLLLDEADRSLHDALCVVRSLVKKRALIPGGSAPEMECSVRLTEYSTTLSGLESYCVKAFADALEVIPYTLAENAGLNPIQIVTELRNMHAKGNKYYGINVRKNKITDIYEENVVQPLLVTVSALTLATECVRMILKIDDLVMSR
eukprot:CAMPEP_0115009290 /NCGR_PEP_ID=MMETSP0216-20121206/22515_1 /TAXON_ID=223996 /ORGANISM="Protocruzia adherens, Strain Boccale" /LENGTH=531 /DNA_ID=CAMNT_0002377051 /DNA_START=92 /DNA_END=1687 /DNA_ORIENTATION=-